MTAAYSDLLDDMHFVALDGDLINNSTSPDLVPARQPMEVLGFSLVFLEGLCPPLPCTSTDNMHFLAQHCVMLTTGNCERDK